MRFIKVFLSCALIFLLCFGVYTFVEQKRNSDANNKANIAIKQPKEDIDQQGGQVSEDESGQSDIDENNTSNNNTSQDNNGNNNLTKPQEVDVAFATSIENIAMLVNPSLSLPENYVPDDLIYPDVRFIFEEKIEKRMLREEAAHALEAMFEAAEKDGIYLAGVSGYRSHKTQTQLFNFYVDRDGYEKAKTYSAIPGTSEHETGLAIDISGSTGKCAAQDCFADTVEAVWLAENSAQYGFIIRYPKGKEHITGYKYEPWHLRYVGKEIALYIFEEGITLEEYYGL